MARPWYGSKRLRIGGVVLLLVLTVALVIPFLVPVDRFRPLLVRLIETGTGREVQIGALRLYLVPTVHLRAVNVRVKNPQGFPRGDAIMLKSVDLGVAPRALLSRRLDVTYIAINNVRVNLLRDFAGRTNFELSAPPQSVPPGGTAPAAGGVPFLTLDHVGAVTVANVEITFASYDPRRGQATPSLTLSGLNARTRSIETNVPDWPRKLEIVGDLRGVRLTTPSLAKPVQFQTGELLVKGGAGRGTFSATLDDMRAEVTAAVASLDPLSATFTVAIPELNVDRLQSLVISGASSSAPTSRAPAAPKRLLARGEVKIDRLTLSPLEATRVSGRLSVYTSKIQLDSYALSVYDGTIQGEAALDHSAAGLPVAVIARVRGINLGRMVSTIAPRARKITGALDADLGLATALGRDPKAALAGAGTFAVRNGSFPGLDLKRNLAQMAKALQSSAPAGETQFSYFGGDLRIAQERVYSTSLRLDAEGLGATAGGSFGFNKTLNYSGTGVVKSLTSGTPPSGGALPSVGQMLGSALPGAAGSTGLRVPFFLRGTVDDPKFSLAGTPQFIREQTPQQPQQQPQQPQQFLPQDLLNLFH